jgi:3-(3-hydroxy-phenyl)propionate hydroxylase
LIKSGLRVVVVGAGPVGVITALALAQRGLDVTVLEADERYDDKPRAATTHASTLEMLATLGVAEEVIAQGLVSHRFQHWDRVSGELVAEFDFARLRDETPFPYAVQCESHKLVTIGLAKLAACGNARVLHRHCVAAIHAGAADVRVDCETPAGPASCAAD